MSLTVTVTDNETGERAEAQVLDGDYLLITAKPCYSGGVQVYPKAGTHVVTIKDCKPTTPPAEEDQDRG